MSRMEILSTRFRGLSSSACPRIQGARTFFYFNRTRVLAKTSATFQALPSSFDRGYLTKALKNDYDFLRDLIGEKFARLVLATREFKVRIQKKNPSHFNFYYGETKQGRKVALLEVF